MGEREDFGRDMYRNEVGMFGETASGKCRWQI
jgi:hypothetical protein